MLVLLCLGCTTSNNKSSVTEKPSEDTTKKECSSFSSLERKMDSMKRKYAPIPEAMLPQYRYCEPRGELRDLGLRLSTLDNA